jgi:hypothetical protein
MRLAIASGWKRIGLALALLALASCGGGGGGGGSSAPATPGSKLFVVDAGNHAIASIVNAAPTLGQTFTVDRIVTGPATGLGTTGGTPSVSSIPSIALDAANDRLFVATQTSVLTFDNVSTANGNVQFARILQSPGVNFLNLSLDTVGNTLYSVDPLGVVHVFNNASTRNGSATPDRTITPDLGTSTAVTTFGIAVDTTVRNLLYVGMALSGATSIFVYNNASAVNTTTTPPKAPDQKLNFTLGIGSFFLDAANDRLYAAQFDGKVLVFDHASLLVTGTPPPTRTIDLTGGFAQVQFFIFVDTIRDKLYAVGNIPGMTAATDQGFVLITDKASTANDVPPNGPQASDGVGTSITTSNIRLSAVAVAP